MTDDKRKLRYSTSPYAPDWAKAPQVRDEQNNAPTERGKQDEVLNERVITSFGKPIPQAEISDPRLDIAPMTIKNEQTPPPIDKAETLFRPTVAQVEEILWQDTNDDIRVYGIINGFRADGLYGRLLNSPDISWAHLFQGSVATRNIQQAPFIIALERGHKLTKWLIETGWGKGWGIYFTASIRDAELFYGIPRVHDKRFLPSNEEQLKLGNLVGGVEDPLWRMRSHFRGFSNVILEKSGKVVNFRYYDPWTMYSYIMTAMEKEFKAITRPLIRLFGETYFISRPSEVFDSFMYSIECETQKVSFFNKENYQRYQIVFCEEYEVFRPFPMVTIAQKQLNKIAILKQEKISYMIYDKIKKRTESDIGPDLYSVIVDLVKHCYHYKIEKLDIIYKYILYFIGNGGQAYRLEQLPAGLSGRKREIALETQLNKRLREGAL